MTHHLAVLHFEQRAKHCFTSHAKNAVTCRSGSLFPSSGSHLTYDLDPWIIRNVPVGHGTFGMVYLASHCKATAIQVACKTTELSKTPLGNRKIHTEDDVQEVRAEVEILKDLQHPNICGVLDMIIDRKQARIFIFLPLVTGGDLFTYLEKYSGLTEDEGQFIAKQLIEAVGYLHNKQIAHRGERSCSSHVFEI